VGVTTENVADFISLANQADQRGQPHCGLLLIDPTGTRVVLDGQQVGS
jgi:hypothetical protein